eukprot:CAMPEP_0194687230 /NCGR_PEP_ID=MMETSP0295-20121207/16079_1 /TAXON_ID=39354 /ORGANISM="Heterosigma akashiwo, Strain CCMP2393" /LENGTH=166 /DNA_ID=CAMNT_0039575415 /DNA_START=1 /DNA_END=501 /DNA_ORIENTATION=-
MKSQPQAAVAFSCSKLTEEQKKRIEDATSLKKMCSASVNRCEACREDSELNETFYQRFQVSVCNQCKISNDDYKLITKAEVVQMFCLPEGTIKVLDFIEKENPRHGTWTPMKLFLQKQVKKYSHDRWGGLEGLLQERRRRDEKKLKNALKRTSGLLKKSKAHHQGK